ncbi:hypothetical protein R83H12_02846 [Fibrobacteria bacterium R8-3-H12]
MYKRQDTDSGRPDNEFARGRRAHAALQDADRCLPERRGGDRAGEGEALRHRFHGPHDAGDGWDRGGAKDKRFGERRRQESAHSGADGERGVWRARDVFAKWIQ